MELKDIMNFEEAGKRLNAITEKWNNTNWEDTNFIDEKADITNKDVLALLISVDEMRNLARFGVEKVRSYRKLLVRCMEQWLDDEGCCWNGEEDLTLTEKEEEIVREIHDYLSKAYDKRIETNETLEDCDIRTERNVRE